MERAGLKPFGVFRFLHAQNDVGGGKCGSGFGGGNDFGARFGVIGIKVAGFHARAAFYGDFKSRTGKD